MNECEEIQPKLFLYVLGDLEWDEHKTVRRHVEQCESCAREARLAVELWDAASLAYVPPSPEFYERCRAAVREAQARGATRRRYRPLQWILPLTAAAVIALAVGLCWWGLGRAPQPDPEEPRASVDQAERLAGPEPDTTPPANERSGIDGQQTTPLVPATVKLSPAELKRRRAEVVRRRDQEYERKVEAMKARRALLKKAQTILSHATGESDHSSALLAEAIVASQTVLAAPQVPYLERLEARRLLYLAYEKSGDLSGYRTAFEEYLGDIAAREGQAAKLRKRMAEASRLQNANEFSRAIEQLQVAVREAAQDEAKAKALYCVGRNLEGLRDYPKALEVYRYAAATFPESRSGLDAALRAASAQVNMHQVEEAIETYRKCVESAPLDRTKAYSLLQIGELQQIRSRTVSSLVILSVLAYQSVIKRFPDTPFAKQAADRLDQLTSAVLDVDF